jgi:RNA polymerase subunit RPABC4/transcription elongation factor Spt4
MPPSRGRHCRRCRARISHRLRVCPLCRAANLKPGDYVIITLLVAGLVALALRWA